MSSVQQLANKARMAEDLIGKLRLQLRSLQTQLGNKGESIAEEIDRLEKENKQLAFQVDKAKDELIREEAKKGIKPIDCSVEAAKRNARDATPAETKQEAPKKEQKQQKQQMSGEKKEDNSTLDSKESKGNKKGNKGGNKGNANKAEEPPVDVSRLDMRAGVIVSAERHPDADALYVEQVDVGESKLRTVISGLVKFVPIEQMQNRKAVLLCNLKPVKMRGILSEAMVMCASTPEKVEIMSPPEDAVPGDLVQVEGFERAPDAVLNPKKKIFEAVAPDLKVNSDGVAVYKDVPWTINGKHCTAQTLRNVNIK